MSHVVKPQVYEMARTQVNRDALEDALKAIGMSPINAREYVERRFSCADTLVEFMGRLCYKSFEVGLNKNVTKIRDDIGAYIGNVLSSKHGSVLEHASVSFAFLGVTRVFTHEIVRHRTGTAFSQESLRYVLLDDIPYREAKFLMTNDFLRTMYDQICTSEKYRDKLTFDRYGEEVKVAITESFMKVFTKSEDAISDIMTAFRLDDIKDFNLKKIVTSALRRLAPIGLATNIGVTANHRAWRHIIETRTSKHAEEEIREVIGMVAIHMKREFPNLYQDMSQNNDGEWVFVHSKV